MVALNELRLLIGGTWTMWSRFLPVLGFWFCLGYGLRFASMQAAVSLGASQMVLANLVFALGLVAWVVCLVLMIASTGPGLRFTTDAATHGGFAEVRTDQSRSEVLVHGVAPFLAVYALGGFAEEQLTDLQRTALTYFGPDYGANQPVRFDQWPVYLAMMVVAWVVLRAVEWWHGRRPGVATGLLQVLAKGVLVLSTFIVITEITKFVTEWLTTRVFWGWLVDGWAAFVGVLPDWRLPFDLTLPEAVREAGAWLVTVALPSSVAAVLLPLTWLALTASVFGWRDLTSNLIGETDAERALRERAEQVSDTNLGRRASAAVASGPLAFAWRRITAMAEDYLPVAQGVRLIARAGASFVAAYLVASALLTTLERAARWGAEYLSGPRPQAEQYLIDPVVDVVVALLGTTLAIALYAKGFDRAILAAASGAGRSHAAAAGEIAERVGGDP